MRVAALYDIYVVLAECSLSLQNTQQLPWERFASYNAAITKLDSMVEVLKLGLDEDDKEEWPTLVGRRGAVDKSEVRGRAIDDVTFFCHWSYASQSRENYDLAL